MRQVGKRRKDQLRASASLCTFPLPAGSVNVLFWQQSYKSVWLRIPKMLYKWGAKLPLVCLQLWVYMVSRAESSALWTQVGRNDSKKCRFYGSLLAVKTLGALSVTLTVNSHALFLLCTDVIPCALLWGVLKLIFRLIEGKLFKWPQKGKVRTQSIHPSCLQLLFRVTEHFNGEPYLLQWKISSHLWTLTPPQ